MKRVLFLRLAHDQGVEVPSGTPLTCKPGADSYVHVSQAALGDNKPAKGNDRVVLKVKVGSTEVVVGTLSQGKCDQTTLDLIFEKDFVLSHNSSGSVYFCGYKTDAVKDDVSGSSDEDEFDASEDEFEEEAPELAQLAAKENGKLGSKAAKDAAANKAPLKSLASKVELPTVEVKSKGKPAIVEELSRDTTDKSDDEDGDEDDENEDEDDDMLGSGSDEDDADSDEDDSDEEDESEEEQPKFAGKKRPLATGKPGSLGKKSKISTPGKPDPKLLSVPASTPKQQPQSAKKEVAAKKTPGKENAVTPASGKKLGQHFCEPCKKNFNSESALNQHKTAKHK